MEKFTLLEIEEPKPSKRECKPCDQKGSYLGRTDCGWRLINDRHKSHTCELLDSNQCDRRFEYTFSPGTLGHQEQNPGSSFAGCKPLDQKLLDENLFSIDPNRLEVICSDPMAISPSRELDDDPVLIPQTDSYIKSSVAALSFLNNLDKKKTEHDNLANEARRCPTIQTPLGSLFGPRPESFEHLHFKHLIEKGYFEKVKTADEDEHQRLIFVTQLLVRGIWDREVASLLFPRVNLPDFEALKKKILWHVRTTMSEKAKRFENIWERLSHKQKEALWLYYMFNPYKRSKEFVAEKIGISVDSFKDRLAGAVKRLNKAFPELVQIGDSQDDESHDPNQPDEPVEKSLPVKIYSREEIKTFEEKRKLNPPQGKPIKMKRPKFNSYKELKEWEKKNTWYPNVSGIF